MAVRCGASAFAPSTDQPFFAANRGSCWRIPGRVDPDSFKGYVAVGGYAALARH